MSFQEMEKLLMILFESDIIILHALNKAIQTCTCLGGCKFWSSIESCHCLLSNVLLVKNVGWVSLCDQMLSVDVKLAHVGNIDRPGRKYMDYFEKKYGH